MATMRLGEQTNVSSGIESNTTVSYDEQRGDQSTVSSMMKSTGFISNMVGYAVEYGTLLYFANFMTSFGIAVLESLPGWLGGKLDFKNLFEGKNVGSLRSYGIILGCFGTGVGFRKFGTFMSARKNVRVVEEFFYGKSKKV
jgi:hypothetical protein